MRYETNRCSSGVGVHGAGRAGACRRCSKPPTRVGEGDRLQILHMGTSRPQELDPHIVQGVGEHNILQALLENLVTEDPIDLHPVARAGGALDISPDARSTRFTCVRASAGRTAIR